ncbi:MAG: hypothetical protein D6768_19350 [Chloroflexi bacterium]|nr:MAG: hypothetical protein D6768_19350 [Chloroflexota bacterium]
MRKFDKFGSIIRVDKPKNSVKGTHGWQVRFPTGVPRKYHSKLFSDGKYGSRGKALVAAEEYLEEYRQTHPYTGTGANRPYWPKEKPLFKNNTSGRTGVYRTHDYAKTDKEKKHKRYYWGAFYSIDGEGNQGVRRHERWYVHEWGEELAKQKAIAFREMWEEAADKGPEAVKDFFEAYRDGLFD